MRRTCALIAGGLLLTSAAQARIDPPARRLASGYSSHALEQGETVIGLATVSHAFTDRLELGTFFVGDVLGIFNAVGKYTVYQDDAQAVAVRLGAVYYDDEVSPFPFEDLDLRFVGLPVAVGYSRDLARRVGLHLDAYYTYADISVEGDGEADLDLPATGFGSGVTLRAALEYDLASGDALYLETWVPVLEAVVAEAADGDAGERKTSHEPGFHRTSVTLSYIASWDTFNLRLGAGVGPSFTDPDTYGFQPALDLFWRI